MWKRTGHKYGAVKQELDGHSFQSKLEAAVYSLLKLRLRGGEIISIQVQDTIPLSLAKIAYIADFKCEKQDGSYIWVEAKGVDTPSWRLKRRLWKSYGPGPLEIWKGSHVKPFLFEVLQGRNEKEEPR